MAITLGTDGWVTLATVKTRMAHLASKLGDANSPLTDTQMEQFITDAFHEINGVLLAQGYTIAGVLADTTGLGVVAMINSYGAAWQIVASLNAMTGGRLHEVVEEYKTTYADKLNALRDGKYKLGDLDSAAAGASVVPTSLLTGGDYETSRYRTDSFGNTRGEYE